MGLSNAEKVYAERNKASGASNWCQRLEDCFHALDRCQHRFGRLRPSDTSIQWKASFTSTLLGKGGRAPTSSNRAVRLAKDDDKSLSTGGCEHELTLSFLGREIWSDNMYSKGFCFAGSA